MTRDMPRAQGTPIMIYRYVARDGRVWATDTVAVRSGRRWRDLHGQTINDEDVLEWAPLIPGPRVTT